VTVRRKITAEVEERPHTPMLPQNFEELASFYHGKCTEKCAEVHD